MGRMWAEGLPGNEVCEERDASTESPYEAHLLCDREEPVPYQRLETISNVSSCTSARIENGETYGECAVGDVSHDPGVAHLDDQRLETAHWDRSRCRVHSASCQVCEGFDGTTLEAEYAPERGAGLAVSSQKGLE